MTDFRHDIERYIKGEMTPSERHALERKALHDPFLADALEGAEQIQTTDFLIDVADLQSKIAVKKSVSVWMWPARIAAGIAIVATSAFIVWSVLETETPKQELALQKEESVDLNSKTDSIAATEVASTGEAASTPASPSTDRAKSAGPPAQPKSQPAVSKPEFKNEPAAAPVAAKADDKEKTKTAEAAEEIKIAESDALAKATEQEKIAEASPVKAKVRENSSVAKKDASADKLSDSISSRSALAAGSSAQSIIRGQVTSAEDGSPISGVNIIIKGSHVGTATDEQGNYQLNIPNAEPTLIYSFIGLQNNEVKVGKKQVVDVQMARDDSRLSEMVVTGSRKKGEVITPTVILAHPEGGDRDFEQYLEKNLRYPAEALAKKVEGRVMVEFTVESDGTLTDFIILKGIGSGCDEELIRLIKEGPKWLPSKVGNVSVNDQAKVRLKFDLP